jgi:hypothetical protein
VTRSTSRRAAALLAGTAMAAGLLLTGCSAGQIAETARKNPSIMGVNAEAQLTDGDGQVVGSVAVRDVLVPYPGQEGYPRLGDAPLEARVFNDTPEPVTVRVLPGLPETDSAQLVRVGSVDLIGGATPSAAPTTAAPVASPTGDGSPAAGESPAGDSPAAESPAAGAPATLEIPAGGFAVLGSDGQRHLRLTGLSDRLVAGASVPLIFQFSNGLELRVNAPVSPPLTPVPRGTPEDEGAEGGH